MEQEDDNHQADDDRLFQQVALQRADRFIDESRPVIACHDFDSGGQRGSDLSQLTLHTFDDIQGVHAVAHNHDAADRFSLAIPFGDALANVRTEADRTDVPDQDGHAVLVGHRHVFEIT